MNIKEIRSMTGLSQAAFAKRYEIPQRTFESWEAGERTPAPYIVKLLHRAVKEDEMIKYIAIDENDLGMDQLIGVYDDLLGANRAAAEAYSILAASEEEKRHIYVLDVKKADLDDPDDWTSYTAGGYCDGRFDSRVWYAVEDSEDESHDHGDGYWLLDEAIESAKAQNDSFPGRFFIAVVDPRDDYCIRKIHPDEF